MELFSNARQNVALSVHPYLSLERDFYSSMERRAVVVMSSVRPCFDEKAV